MLKALGSIPITGKEKEEEENKKKKKKEERL
jgi:hypothetical protein